MKTLGKKRRRFRAELWNPNTIEKFQMEGRGREEDRGENYLPWLKVQDVPSRGICSRIRGWKSGRRDVHLLSNWELYHFYTLEWEDDVVDCREQFPLIQPLTALICEDKGYDHPSAGPDKLPIVMTTDARITRKKPDGSEYDACRSVKPRGSWTFVAEDIRELPLLVAKLRQQIPSHQFTKWLFDQFSDAAQSQVLAYRGGEDVRLLQTLVFELNKLMASRLLFSQELFAGVHISPETWEAVEALPTGHEITRVNALLMRNAFPRELTDTPPVDGLTRRDHEKFEVEKEYWWTTKQIRCELVTGESLDMILAKNVEAVHTFYFLAPYGISEETAKSIGEYLLRRVEHGNQPLAEIALAADRDLQQPAGTSLVIAKNRIATKVWKVDFTLPFEPWKPVNLL